VPDLVTASPSERTGRPRRLAVIAVLVVVAIGAALAAVIVGGGGAERSSVSSAPLPTVPVTTGDMVSATNARATLHYAQESALAAASGGVVTALPSVGTVIAPGGALYRINNVPVMLLRGALPAWRTFETGMAPGEDVRQLEQNLTAFGVFRGDADATFTKATAAAVRAWQKSLGVEQTGKLDRTAVLFADHDLRVARATAALGAEASPGTELYRVSSTTKIVDLDLRLGDQQLAVVGGEVGITLPDGTTTTGSIAAVGEPLEREAEDSADAAAGGTYVVPVTVTVADQAAVGGFPRASVTVQFSSTLADGVLTVPVEALVAIDAERFAVETPGAAAEVRSIPVTVGAFASGRVEIAGKGIREGLPVVVPAP
jgi:peptidoglycan hydrolase-like protein with peptidoglycan-binding domain